ncbi:hypothetical protein BJ170DRAFT_250709 [Xylariales sp. AK1849]|nr:hypothetical protein BJ170DRAFT_250709 [Xylariales sp. AK1849]
MNYTPSNMPADASYATNRHATGTATTSTQGAMTSNHAGGGAASPYSGGQATGIPDPGIIVPQNATLADAGMTSITDQFGGLHVAGLQPRLQTVPNMPNIQYMTNDTAAYPGNAYHHHAGVTSLGHHGIAIPSTIPYLNENGMVVGVSHIPPELAQAYGLRPYQPSHIAHQLSGAAPRNAGEMQEWLARNGAEYARQYSLAAAQQDVPGLEDRRSSYSTTTESSPATPFFGSTASRDNGNRVLVFERSNYTTPSPQQVTSGGLAAQPKRLTSVLAIDQELQSLLALNPAIPRAVPAVFTPQENMKTLEQSLINHIPGNRNVYIRGLHPTTDDNLLLKYAERFGHVETSKAIIDTATRACKGFGFAKFQTVRESESCIRGFFALGYEVGFARESFNSRLKAEGDDNSTNLYISNLPKSVTENELSAIFVGYTILSSKILRDSLGNSRGVGFAR